MPIYNQIHVFKWVCVLIGAFCIFGQVGLGITALVMAFFLWLGDY